MDEWQVCPFPAGTAPGAVVSVPRAGRGHSRDVPVCRGPAGLCEGLPAGAQGVKLLIARG